MDATGSINNEACFENVVENEEEIIDDSEERELVTDSCSTKVLDTAEQPKDNYRIVYVLFYLFGVTSLVPWNFLITANDVSINLSTIILYINLKLGSCQFFLYILGIVECIFYISIRYFRSSK